ncbi:MAG: right-handed parallel beta-helix repeat-containing protein [Thermoplasmata archaeon]
MMIEMGKGLMVFITLMLVSGIWLSGSGGELNLKEFVPHGPIYISSDAEFNASNGVSGGSGTQADPYIITNLEIDARGGSYGIYIEFTSAHFKIINCKIYNATRGTGAPYGCGIALNSVTNGTVESCRVSENRYSGIWVRNSYNVVLRGNLISNNTQNGITVANSPGVIVENNSLLANRDAGILLQDSEAVILRNNSLMLNDIQITGDTASYWDSHVIENNTVNRAPAVYLSRQSNIVVNSECGQIIIANSTNINITGVPIFQASVALQVGFSEGILILNCTLESNWLYGVYIYGSSQIEIIGCTIYDNQRHGIFAEKSEGIQIRQCLVSENIENGIHFLETRNSLIAENSIANNRGYGVYLTFGSTSNEIHHNDFIGNHGATAKYDANHTQSYDSTGGNTWCPNNYGNYWSDWAAPDADGNFVVDAPYILDGAAGVTDMFPLRTEHHQIWIYHTPVKYVEENSQIKVNAGVRTVVPVSKVELKYIPLQGSQETAIQMVLISGNSTDGTYEGTIPAQVGTGYLKYYIEANASDSGMRTPAYICIVGELPMNVNLSLSQNQIGPGETTTVTVRVSDAGTHAMLAGAEVSLECVNLSGTFDNPTGYTDTNGIFVANFTAAWNSPTSTGKIITNVRATGYKPSTAEIFLTISSSIRPPSAPTGLTATPGDREVLLRWQPPADDGGSPIIAYTVYWGPQSGSYSNNQDVGNVLTYMVEGLTNGQTYYFAVSAKNAIGEGQKSNEVSATPSSNQQLYNLSVSITLSQIQIISGNFTNVTVTVKNESSGEFVANALVRLGVEDVPGVFETQTGYTNEHGMFTTKFIAGEVSANITGKILANVSAPGYNPAMAQKSITVYPPGTFLHTLSVEISVSSGEVNAGETIILTVTVRDENNKPVSGANVTIEVMPLVCVLDSTTKTTGNGGYATFSLTANSDIEKDTVVIVKVRAGKEGYGECEKTTQISVKKKWETRPTPGFEFLLLSAAFGAGMLWQKRKQRR